MTRQIGNRATLRNDLHKTHGDYYWKLNGLAGIIKSIDKPDEDGEPVYGFKVGREFHTITETMLK